MNVFSEESQFLIENWDTVEDILKAEKQLCAELASFLLSVRAKLVECDWWQDEWEFCSTGATQSYISNRNWKVGNNFAIWIGVEGFTPKAIFGVGTPPTLYVWVSGKRVNLVTLLSERIKASQHNTLGKVVTGSSGYVVKHAVEKCLPGDTDEFPQTVRRQIADFFTFYAKLLNSFDSAIQTQLAGD